MAKPRIPNQRKANIEHKKRTERYAQLIQQLYDRVAQEAARSASLAGIDSSKPFSFADYPLTKESIQGLQQQLSNDVGAIIMSGTSEEWKESNLIQNLVAQKVLKAYTGTTKSGEEYTRYYKTNPDALSAFQKRREGGMNLSDRVWNLSEEYRVELEDAISAAIAPGISAQELSREVKKYLNEPDLMFRRFRYKNEQGEWKRKWKKRYIDEEGNVRFIDCDRDSYRNQWTGPGYYKSAAKNAMRLARTEINMAYRTAEQTRWEQFDFVVGYEVKTTQNGHHIEDICDNLAGKYPKDFKFVGWHPQCMCYTIPILMTEDEFLAHDEDNPVKSVNEITDMPTNFKDWIKDNRERIEAAEKRGKLPYFIRDNREDVEDILNPKQDKKYPEELILVKGIGDPIFDYIDSYNLPKTIHNQMDEIKQIKTFNQIRDYFAKFGIEVTTDEEELYNLGDQYIENIASMGQKLIIAHKTYTETLGSDVLKSLKRINFFDDREDFVHGQAAYFFNTLGEEDPWAGTLRIRSINLNGHGFFHELAHAIQDSVKRPGEDAVMAATRIVRKCALDDSVRAYFGAASSEMDAERMADAFANIFTKKKYEYELKFYNAFMKYRKQEYSNI